MLSQFGVSVLQHLAIAKRIQILATLPIIFLLAMAGTSIYSTLQISNAGDSLYAEGIEASKRSGEITLLIEQLKGQVGSVPAEFDLGKQAEIREAFTANLAIARERIEQLSVFLPEDGKAAIQEMLVDMQSFDEAAGSVFDFASAFAQDQAIQTLTESVSPIEKKLATSLQIIVNVADRASEQSFQSLQSTSQNTVWLVGLAVAICTVLTLVAGFAVTGSVTKPLAQVTDAMRSLSDGNFDQDVPGRGVGHEIGAMADALMTFKENGQRMREMAEEERNRFEADAERTKELTETARQLEKCIGTTVLALQGRGQELQNTSETLNQAALSLRDQAGTADGSSREASDAVGAVSAATGEFSSVVDEINKQVNEVAEITKQSSEDAESDRCCLDELNEATKRIGDVVSLIREIAEQTNLLALNATIEAARAGEMGRGFSVVAAEVKALASQTANATNEIEREIDRLNLASDTTVGAYAKLGKSLANISHITGTIAAATNEQEATTSNMAQNLSSASDQTRHVTLAIQQVRQTADNNEGLAETVRSVAVATLSEIDELKTQAGAYLDEMRKQATAAK